MPPPEHPTRRLLPALGILLAFGGTAVATEFTVLRSRLAAPPSTTRFTPSPRASPPRPVPAATAAVALRDILSRPLFTSGRHPPSGPSNHPDALPRLAGIVATPASTTAIFAGEHDGERGEILLAGASIDGWTLSRITPHEVWLRRNDRELRLRPHFGTSPDLPPPPPLRPDLRRVLVLGAKHVNPQLAW